MDMWRSDQLCVLASRSHQFPVALGRWMKSTNKNARENFAHVISMSVDVPNKAKCFGAQLLFVCCWYVVIFNLYFFPWLATTTILPRIFRAGSHSFSLCFCFWSDSSSLAESARGKRRQRRDIWLDANTGWFMGEKWAIIFSRSRSSDGVSCELVCSRALIT